MRVGLLNLGGYLAESVLAGRQPTGGLGHQCGAGGEQPGCRARAEASTPGPPRAPSEQAKLPGPPPEAPSTLMHERDGARFVQKPLKPEAAGERSEAAGAGGGRLGWRGPWLQRSSSQLSRGFVFFRQIPRRGTWVAQSLKHLPLAQVMKLGSWDGAPQQLPAPWRARSSPSLCCSPCSHSLSNKILKKKKNHK